MKDKMILSSLLLAALCLCCTKEKEPDAPEARSEDIRFSLTALSPFDDVEVKWESVADRVGVFLKESSDTAYLNFNAYYDAFSSTTTSLFNPLKDSFRQGVEEGKSYDVAIYYPFSTKVTDPGSLPVSIPSLQKVEAGDGSVVKDSSLLSARNFGFSAGSPLSLSLSPVEAFVRVALTCSLPYTLKAVTISSSDGNLSLEGGSYNLLTGQLNIDAASLSSSVRAELREGLVVGREASFVLFRVNPLFKGGQISVAAEFEEASVEPIVVSVPAFSQGSGIEISLDLSVEAKSLGPAANCYVVSEPGTLYCFDATLKGNGNSTPVSWTSGGEAVSLEFDTAISPNSAQLLWYSSPKTSEGYTGRSPVVDVYYDSASGQIYFRTPDDFVDGNAVIAAFDGDGNILWSWNIWAVKGWNPNENAVQVGRYVMMDRNLGSVAGSETAGVTDNLLAARAIGNYYQWGRKDPFPAAAEYTDGSYSIPEGWGNEAYTDLDDYKIVGSRIFSDNASSNALSLSSALGSRYTLQQAVEQGVSHPHKWLFGGSGDACYPQYAWFNGEGDYDAESETEKVQWEALWGSTDNVSSVKTIYDPCPAGWKVPTADVWYSAFENAQLSSGAHGISVPQLGLYFPFAGQRKAGFGGSVIVSSAELMLSSATALSSLYPARASATLSSDGSVGAARVTAYNSYAGAGYQVRCVREEVAGSADGYGSQGGHDAALMGDSITRTWRDRGRASFFTENNYLNKGADGTTTVNMVGRFAGDILSDDPAVVFIMGGTNDFAQNDGYFESAEDIVSNVRLMAKAARDEGAAVVIGSICPSDYIWWKDEAWNSLYGKTVLSSEIIYANSLLKAMAEENGYRYADFHTLLKDSDNALAREYRYVLGTNADGTANLDSVHPNAAAFSVMEGVLKPLIDALLLGDDAAGNANGNADDFDRWTW